MVSKSIIYTFLFTMGILLLIDTMHASSVHNKDDRADLTSVKASNYDHDDTSLSLKKRATEDINDFADEYPGFTFSKHRFQSRGARLPSESILLGKRRLPVESILLGKRRLPAESILLGKRRLPAESILLGKRRLPVEAVLLGRRDMPHEDDFHNERR